MTTNLFFEPIARTAYVRPRLSLVRPVTDDSAVDWDEVQRAIEDVLHEIEATVARRCPGVKTRIGANRSRPVLLYSYGVFEPPSDPEADPIVLGVAFKRTPSNVILVRGDLCAEESGRVLFSPPDACREVPERGPAVLDAASKVIARLAREVDTLITLIREAEPA